MKSMTLFLACSCAIMAISCQKNKQTPPAEPPVNNSGTVRVQLKLTGDILTSESPLGRRANEDVLSGARNFGNTTLYSISVTRVGDWRPASTGLFSHVDSMYINAPTSGQYKISISVYKKGTGSGLFYTVQNGLFYFDYPINFSLKNRMDSITDYVFARDSVYHLQLANPLDSSNYLQTVYYPQVDYYQGDTSYAGSANPAPISINVKRRSFGVKLSATNFTGGKLKAEFGWDASSLSWPLALPFSVTPGDIGSRSYVLASDELKSRDSTMPILTRVTWEKPGGGTVHLGDKTIYYKRNVLTTLHVTIPTTGGTSVAPRITETDWSGNEIINF
ncbi:hypothetical protein AAHN97_09635 [Chitinophaga niabensis]|uniref:hypothetical protein n=1 Tax=Chitinophaga niabensis TaxID=536979 RepID=UPI0031BA7FB8